MDIESLSETIKKALDYFDYKTTKYQYLINCQNIEFEDNSIITFSLEDRIETYKWELLGYFDYQNKIWIWGWVLPGYNYSNTQLCKYLLDYGLKLELGSANQEQTMIKGILVNSRITIEEDVQLEINLAIYAYLIKERVKFILPKKKFLDKTNTKYVTLFYLIK